MLSYSITWVECIICSKHLTLFLDVLTITIILISRADSESKPGDCIKNPQALPSFLPREHNLEQLAILIQPRDLNSVDLEVHDAWTEATPPSDRQDGGRWLPLLFPEEKLFCQLLNFFFRCTPNYLVIKCVTSQLFLPYYIAVEDKLTFTYPHTHNIHKYILSF